MRPSALLLAALTLPGLAAAEAPFDLKALRAAHPGADSVVLERQYTISHEDENTMRVAVHEVRAILDDVGGTDLILFEEEERPHCREPRGVRIEVTTAEGETLLTTTEDLVQLPAGAFSVWKGPRNGVATGALIEESYHIDYGVHCFGGLGAVQRTLGDEVPVLDEEVLIQCEDCGVAVSDGLTIEADGADSVVRWSQPLPAPAEAHRPPALRPVVYVSTDPDPAAYGRILADELAEASKAWGSTAGAWGKWAKTKAAGMTDKTAALAYGLSRAPVYSSSSVWEYGIGTKDPIGPENRTLLPLEWLAIASRLLPKGVPVLYTDSRRPVPEDAATVFDWDELGIWLPDHGLVTTRGWYPTLDGRSEKLAGHTLLRLDTLEMMTLPGVPEGHRRRTDVVVSPSGLSSLLVEVDTATDSGWGRDVWEGWGRRVAWAKKRKAKLHGVAREYAADALFDGRRLAGTTIEEADGGGLRVQTAWTEKEALRRGEGWRIVPVVAARMPGWLGAIERERELPILLGAREESGTVRVVPPDGYVAKDLPASTTIEEGPLRWSAVWAHEGDAPVLTWSLRIAEDQLPADLAGAVGAVAAAIDQTRRTRLVFEPR